MMYTQVTFGQFLDSVIEQLGIEFNEYPNVAISWCESDWGYEVLNDMSVRVFRYGQQDRERKVDGPKWHDNLESRELFEPRFDSAFRSAVSILQ